MQMVCTTRGQATKIAAVAILSHLFSPWPSAYIVTNLTPVKGKTTILPHPLPHPSSLISVSNSLPRKHTKERPTTLARMPLTNFDSVSKSFDTNLHNLLPTSYIPSFNPPFYASLPEDNFPPIASSSQQQQQDKRQSSQQKQHHDTESYSEKGSVVFEKDLPPEPRLENTKLRRRRRVYLWCKNKAYSVDWKSLTSRILSSSYLLRLFREPLFIP